MEADGGGAAQIVAYIAIIAVPLLAAIILHEVAHGVVAYMLGDPTAARHGRLTLNPIPHIDPVGTILLPGVLLITARVLGTSPFVFGWAKPVPIDPRRFANPRRDSLLVALAGPATNLLLAAARVAVVAALPESAKAGSLVAGLGQMAIASVWINTVLAVFNMIPVPPLDGGNVLAGLLQGSAAEMLDRVRPYGFIVIYVLLLSGILWTVIDPIAYSIQSILL